MLAGRVRCNRDDNVGGLGGKYDGTYKTREPGKGTSGVNRSQHGKWICGTKPPRRMRTNETGSLRLSQALHTSTIRHFPFLFPSIHLIPIVNLSYSLSGPALQSRTDERINLNPSLPCIPKFSICAIQPNFTVTTLYTPTY